MAKTNTLLVVKEAEFKRICNDLKDNSDFFDPIYLEGDDWTPLTKEYYSGEHAPEGFDENEYWEVVNFLQSYSDVDLVEASHVRKEASAWSSFISSWYDMYLDEVTHHTPAQSYDEGWQRSDLPPVN